MKFLVTGAAGQLGYDVLQELKKRKYEAAGTDLAEENETNSYVSMDITDEKSVRDTLEKIKPDIVIHCAAWTNVDEAEETENKEKVWNINVEGTKNLARMCRTLDAKMIYISTDYVFDGQGNLPWKADSAKYSPQNFYGKTKLEGEQAVQSALEKYVIVRTAWVFGRTGNNFVKTMLRLGKKYDELQVVCDQIGTPTYTKDLARLLVDMAETDKYGCYHVTNEGGYISWYEFATEIFRQAGELGVMDYDKKSPRVYPVTTEEYGRSKAVRPLNSRLDRTKLWTVGFQPLPDWKDALCRYLQDLRKKGWNR